uniref:Glycosyltransferase 2-like domain-containing protein n=1 Tax=viral metagenome TaxID=1070528 RepID=A0A6C0HCK8_9ZZZZ
MRMTIEEIDSDPNPTLCLNMIVKNESRIITRLLDSVVSIIDCYCICDTGSTDNTKDIIREYFEKKNIHGKIVEEPFVDFAHNRNFALQCCIGMSDYVLFLDADMVLEIKPGFDKTILKSHDSFMILQGTDDFYYNNMRIVRNNGSYLYIGVTHEYISTPPQNTTMNFDKSTLFIRDIGDGGAKSDKYDRDIKLLKGGIEENPNSDRYHFYLANSYFDNGKYEDAIETYKRRIEIGGWDQEVWYSYYRMGMSYKNLGKIELAISAWLDGYDLLPNRLENLYEIIQHYRILNKCRVANGFYKMAKDVLKIAHDKDNYLFLNNDMYTYKLEYEMTILACYLGIKNINNEAITVFNHCNEQHLVDNLLSNMKFYKDILKHDANLDFCTTINHQIANKERVFKSSSSSIIPNPHGEGYLMNMRLVNYTIDSNGYYHDCDDYIISINKYIKFTRDFEIVEEKLIDSPFDDRRYIGVEDVRIFAKNADAVVDADVDADVFFMGTSLHQNGNIGISSGIYNKNMQYMEAVEVKPSFSNSDCEKNWVFVNVDNEALVVYKWYPLHLCRLNKEKKSLDLVRKVDDLPKIFKHMRGSSSGTEFNNEIWFITHIVSYEQPRHYYHMFVVFDKSMKLLRYSAPFKFEGECIEYCIGLVVEKDRIIVPYSTWDRTTKIAIYDKKYIDSLVKYNQ